MLIENIAALRKLSNLLFLLLFQHEIELTLNKNYNPFKQ